MINGVKTNTELQLIINDKTENKLIIIRFFCGK